MVDKNEAQEGGTYLSRFGWGYQSDPDSEEETYLLGVTGFNACGTTPDICPEEDATEAQ